MAKHGLTDAPRGPPGDLRQHQRNVRRVVAVAGIPGGLDLKRGQRLRQRRQVAGGSGAPNRRRDERTKLSRDHAATAPSSSRCEADAEGPATRLYSRTTPIREG